MWSSRLPQRLGSLLSRQSAAASRSSSSSSSSSSSVAVGVIASCEASTSRLQQQRTLSTSARRNDDDSTRDRDTFSSFSSANQQSFLPGLHAAGRGSPTFSRGAGGPNGFIRSEAFNLHVKASRNNTIMTLTTPQGQPISRVSSGMCGFKHSGRSGYEAGHQSAMRMFGIIQENQLKWRLANLNVIFNGFGLGREAVYRALMTDDGAFVRNLVRRLADSTRIRVGGCRPKKRRML